MNHVNFLTYLHISSIIDYIGVLFMLQKRFIEQLQFQFGLFEVFGVLLTSLFFLHVNLAYKGGSTRSMIQIIMSQNRLFKINFSNPLLSHYRKVYSSLFLQWIHISHSFNFIIKIAPVNLKSCCGLHSDPTFLNFRHYIYDNRYYLSHEKECGKVK